MTTTTIFYTGPFPIPYPIDHYGNDPISYSFQYKDENNVAVDISSYPGVFEIREYENGPVLLQLTEGSGVTNGGSSGIYTYAVTTTQMQTIQTNHAFYEFRATVGSDVVTFMTGRFDRKSRFSE
ncbi:MAG: hypothetical protein WC455_21830 [Dehalococcoidia bacterium]|jgi:hypothetical protein